MRDHLGRPASEDADRHKEALAAMAGLTLWRAREAPAMPRPDDTRRPQGVFERLPPLA